MPRKPLLLFVVEDSFEIQNVGLVLSPGLTRETNNGRFRVQRPSAGLDDETIYGGDKIELRRPDGTVLPDQLRMNMLTCPDNGKYPISVSRELTKLDIPLGTEVWWIPSDPAASGI